MAIRNRGGLVLGAAMASALTGGAAIAQVDLSGFERVGEVAVPLTGREVALPLPEGAGPADLRIVLAGLFECSYNGRTYDAFNTRSDMGEFDQRHDYVRWSPEDMEPADYDASTHQCVLKLREGEGALPRTVTAWVNVDQFVTDFITVTPSEVQASLSGDLRLELWRATRSSPGPLIVGAILLALVVVVASVLLRRGRPAEEMADVAELLARIERKCESALSGIEGQRADAFELSSQLERLRDGAQELAEHIAAFRGAAATVDRQQLEGEIAQVQQQLQQAERDDLRSEIESTLAAKRKLSDLLADTDANEARYLLRLSKIESTIDATTMWVTGQETRLADEVGEDRAIAELDQELESLDAAIEELKVLD
ncbi:MAG: hypothetical protein ACE5R4_17240 [Armatimonadota bacterium]